MRWAKSGTLFLVPDDAAAESLQVSAELEAEFEQALQYRMTDEDLETGPAADRDRHGEPAAASCIGRDRRRPPQLGARGRRRQPALHRRGVRPDDRWGTQIGHGTMMGHVKTPMLGDPIPDEIKKQTKGMFRGVHVFVSGGTWDWFRPLRPGDRLYSFSGEESLEVKKSEFAGRPRCRSPRPWSSTSSATCSACTASCGC